MNPGLEALIRAYDAAKQASPDEVVHLRAVYDALLKEVLQRYPQLSRQTLEGMVRFARNRWLRAQSKPGTLPPRA